MKSSPFKIFKRHPHFIAADLSVVKITLLKEVFMLLASNNMKEV